MAKTTLTPGTRADVTGRLRKIIASYEGSFHIFEIDADDGQRIKAKGNSAIMREGLRIRVVGPVEDTRFGYTIKASAISAVKPTSPDEMVRFIASGIYPGIGGKLAISIVKRFGILSIDVIERTPERLKEIKGLSEAKVEEIAKVSGGDRISAELVELIGGYGFTLNRAMKIFEKMGRKTIEVITHDPYALMQVDTIGFRTADEIALTRFKISPDSPVRIAACLKYLLDENLSSGNCGMDAEKLTSSCTRLLNIDYQKVFDAYEAAVERGELIQDDVLGKTHVFRDYVVNTENAVAQRVQEFLNRPFPGDFSRKEIRESVGEATKKNHVKLSGQQVVAVSEAMAHGFSIITGAPGTGKTTIIRTVVDSAAALGLKVALAAPTGKASQRLGESVGTENAKTIHRLLEPGRLEDGSFGFRRNQENPVEADIVVIDESSMIDIFLTRRLFDAIPPDAAVLIVGDNDQLPSVGPGRILGDLIDSGRVPTTRLMDIVRQARNSKIIKAAHDINNGRFIPYSAPDCKDDFRFIPGGDSPEAAADQILATITRLMWRMQPIDPIADIQVLSPMKDGACGVNALNKRIQALVNPEKIHGRKRESLAVKFEDEITEYRLGDKVMYLDNDIERGLTNGLVGRVKHIDKKAGSLSVDFDGNVIQLRSRDLKNLTLSYASTIHKFQGSEAPAIIFPVIRAHGHMLKRNLIYTGLTRGRKQVIMVGDQNTLYRASNTIDADVRITRLKHLLQMMAPKPSRNIKTRAKKGIKASF